MIDTVQLASLLKSEHFVLALHPRPHL